MSKRVAEVFDGVPTTFTGKMFATSARCHCFAAFASALIVAVISWIWINQEWFAADPYQTTEKIAEAQQLISESDQWEQRFNEQTLQLKNNAKRTNAIRSWLPSVVDWSESSERIAKLVSSNDLKLILLERDEDDAGTRVSIVPATCVIGGSFENICHFLDALPKMDHPVWCDSLELALSTNQPSGSELDNLGESSDSERPSSDDEDHRRCTATLSLRLPFAGSSTAAAKLFASEDNHAS